LIHIKAQAFLLNEIWFPIWRSGPLVVSRSSNTNL